MDINTDTDDQKKYNILENILQKINQKYIALPEDEVKRNNKLLSAINTIIQKMRSKSSLFDNLYQNKYYGGSYYDRLRVGKPSEYDLDCLLRLPKIVQATIEPSDKPGYVHLNLNLDALKKKVDEAPKYVGLEKLMDGDRLSTQKVKSWMEGLMASVLSGSGKIKVKIDEAVYKIRASSFKSGPALTIKLQGMIDGNEIDVDVDLVPCFTFFDGRWPRGDYRQNPSKSKTTFFVVPKSPDGNDGHYWRLSFQEQEKELINGYAVMKPTIRLIKKIRDRYQHKIASYFIKTVFLWELERNTDKSLWQKSLSYVFMIMLRKYREYIVQKNIPYYWNEKYNLIENLQDDTVSCIANKLKNIADDVDRSCSTDPYGVVKYFLLQSEYDIETFKQEIPLSKKQLRQISCLRNKSADNLANGSSETESLSSQSSTASSFEEISKDMVDEPSASSGVDTRNCPVL